MTLTFVYLTPLSTEEVSTTPHDDTHPSDATTKKLIIFSDKDPKVPAGTSAKSVAKHATMIAPKSTIADAAEGSEAYTTGSSDTFSRSYPPDHLARLPDNGHEADKEGDTDSDNHEYASESGDDSSEDGSAVTDSDVDASVTSHKGKKPTNLENACRLREKKWENIDRIGITGAALKIVARLRDNLEACPNYFEEWLGDLPQEHKMNKPLHELQAEYAEIISKVLEMVPADLGEKEVFYTNIYKPSAITEMFMENYETLARMRQDHPSDYDFSDEDESEEGDSGEDESGEDGSNEEYDEDSAEDESDENDDD
ncbi:unnamed protein product [Rhizoctonia solani]|uniref:Uncharacterized protein n=1 Tax=Rhizoctonia solani TaxID=456999 RepID=A0A8H3B1Y2_9AGAM|nr:unnamed protein product [Rhizoctonia solani]